MNKEDIINWLGNWTKNHFKEKSISEILKRDFSYENYVKYLNEKYGKITNNYKSNKNKSKHFPNESLYIHHVQEIKIPGLSNKTFVKKLNLFQQGDDLVFCNLLEHGILHFKIQENNNFNIEKNLEWLKNNNEKDLELFSLSSITLNSHNKKNNLEKNEINFGIIKSFICSLLIFLEIEYIFDEQEENFWSKTKEEKYNIISKEILNYHKKYKKENITSCEDLSEQEENIVDFYLKNFKTLKKIKFNVLEFLKTIYHWWKINEIDNQRKTKDFFLNNDLFFNNKIRNLKIFKNDIMNLNFD